MKVEPNPYLPDGRVLLIKDDVVVWCGDLKGDWPDIEFDKVTISISEYERMKAALDAIYEDEDERMGTARFGD